MHMEAEEPVPAVMECAAKLPVPLKIRTPKPGSPASSARRGHSARRRWQLHKGALVTAAWYPLSPMHAPPVPFPANGERETLRAVLHAHLTAQQDQLAAKQVLRAPAVKSPPWHLRGHKKRSKDPAILGRQRGSGPQEDSRVTAHMKSGMTRWKAEPLKWSGLPLLPTP